MFLAIGNLAHLPAVSLWGLLPGFAILCLAACINGIFRCAMYIYASGGMPPGPFDTEVFNSAWVVRSRWSAVCRH
jgi:hypothetical protein